MRSNKPVEVGKYYLRKDGGFVFIFAEHPSTIELDDEKKLFMGLYGRSSYRVYLYHIDGEFAFHESTGGLREVIPSRICPSEFHKIHNNIQGYDLRYELDGNEIDGWKPDTVLDPKL